MEGGKEDHDDDNVVENPVKGEVELEKKGSVAEDWQSSASSNHEPEEGKNYESKFLTASEWDDEKIRVDDKIVKGLREEGFLNPSKIQAYAIPNILNPERKHMIAQSQNGSGKTLAFSVPAL